MRIRPTPPSGLGGQLAAVHGWIKPRLPRQSVLRIENERGTERERPPPRDVFEKAASSARARHLYNFQFVQFSFPTLREFYAIFSSLKFGFCSVISGLKVKSKYFEYSTYTPPIGIFEIMVHLDYTISRNNNITLQQPCSCSSSSSFSPSLIDHLCVTAISTAALCR